MIIFHVESPSGEQRIVHLASDKAVIGRNRQCDLQLEHETVSKYHAEILKTGPKYTLRDLQSYNGTYVNDEWVTEASLSSGDKLKVGRYTVTFLTETESKQGRGGISVQRPFQPAAEITPATGRKRLALAVLFVLCLVECVALLYLTLGPKTRSGLKQPPPPEKAATKPPEKAATKPPDKQEVKPETQVERAGTLDRNSDKAAQETPRQARKQGPRGKKRPPFRVTPSTLPAAREILLRRVYLDIAGRPPTWRELEEKAGLKLTEVIEELASEPAHKELWKEGLKSVVQEIRGEKLTGEDKSPVQHLSELYKSRLHEHPPRKKGSLRLAGSLMVDLWQTVPAQKERRVLADAIESSGPFSDALPVAAFLLGEVEPPENLRQWVKNLLIRFLLKEPTEGDIRTAMSFATRKGGPRGLVLGLASCKPCLLPRFAPCSPAPVRPKVILIDLQGFPAEEIAGSQQNYPHIQELCREGAAFLKVDSASADPVLICEKLLASGKEPLLSQTEGKSFLLAPSTDPFRKLSGDSEFYAPDFRSTEWKEVFKCFGPPGPTSGEALDIAWRARKRFGSSEVNTGTGETVIAETRMLCAGQEPQTRDLSILEAVLTLLSQKEPLIAAVLQGPAGRDTGKQKELFKRKEEFFGKVYKRLQPLRERAVFAYISPFSLLKGEDKAGDYGFCVLWGKPFRKGVVHASAVHLSDLRDIMLNAAGVKEKPVIPEIMRK